AQSMGYNPVDPEMGQPLMDEMMYTLSIQPNAQQFEQRLGAMGDMVTSRNQSARLVGAPNIDPNSLMGTRYESDPDFGMVSMANNQQAMDMVHRNREFYNDGAAGFFMET